MALILSDQPTPEQLPPTSAGIVHQMPRTDLIPVCTACGAVVAWGFEERHADTHAATTPDA